MISWCTECKTVAIEPIEDGHDVRCFSCSWREGLLEAIRRPIDVETLLGPYHAPEYFAPKPDPVASQSETGDAKALTPPVSSAERAYINLTVLFDELEKVWETRTPRIEFNTVDLAELRREQEEYRDNAWVEVGERPDGRPIYLRKYDSIHY